MNTAKYKLPQKDNREKVSQEKFCQDCKKNKIDCNKEVEYCIKEATLYQKFLKISKEHDK